MDYKLGYYGYKLNGESYFIPFSEFENFEFAVIAAKHFSGKLINEKIVVNSPFFEYVYVNGVEQ